MSLHARLGAPLQSTSVDALTEAHGGSVHAASPGIGQRCDVQYLSASCSGTTCRGDERRPFRCGIQGLSGLRVLVLDDEADARELMAMTLEQSDAIPVEAGSVREALRLLHDQRPDVILADIELPEQDGFEFMRIVRKYMTAARVPSIAVTAYVNSNEREKALRAGYDAHIAKPVERQRLLTAVARVLNDRTADGVP